MIFRVADFLHRVPALRTAAFMWGLMLLCPHASAFKGYMIKVTGNPGEIKSGTEVIAEVSEGTPLWVFEEKAPNWVLVKVPSKEQKGWLSSKHHQKTELTDNQKSQLKISRRHYENYKGYKKVKRFDRALESLSSSLSIKRDVYGEEHPSVARTHSMIGSLADDMGDHATAEHHLKKSLNIRRDMLGAEDADTLRTMSLLSYALNHQKKHEAAKTLREQLLRTRRKTLGVKHPKTLRAMYQLAYVLDDLGEFDAAIELAQENARLRAEVLGVSDPATARSRKLLNYITKRQSRLETVAQDNQGTGESVTAQNLRTNQPSVDGIATLHDGEPPGQTGLAVAGSLEQLVTHEMSIASLNPTKPRDFMQRLEDISDDGRIAAIDRRGKSFDVVDTQTGKLLCRLPAYSNSGGYGVLRISPDKQTLWSLPRKSDKVNQYITAGPETIKEYRKNPNFAELNVIERGMGLRKWDIATGESVGELKPEKRLVVAFDLCESNGMNLVAAVEGVIGGGFENGYFIAIYNADTNEKLADFPMTPKFSPPGRVHWINHGRSLLVCSSAEGLGAVTCFDVANLFKPTLKWTGTASSLATILENEAYAATEINRSNVEVRRIDLNTGKTTRSWVFRGKRQIAADSHRARISVNSNGLLMLSGLYYPGQANGGFLPTMLLDTSSSTWQAKLSTTRIFDSFLSDTELLSIDGVYSLAGELLRQLERKLAPRDGIPLITADRLAGNIIGSSPRTAIVAKSGQLRFIDKANGDQLSKLTNAQLQSINDSQANYDLKRAVAIYVEKEGVFYVGLPHEFDDLEARCKRLYSQNKNRDNFYGYAMTPEKIRRVVKGIEGTPWHIIKVSPDGHQPKSWNFVESSTWMQMVEVDGQVAIVRLGHHHKVVELLVPDKDSKLESRWSIESPDAPNRIRALISQWLTSTPDLSAADKLHAYEEQGFLRIVVAANMFRGFDQPMVYTVTLDGLSLPMLPLEYQRNPNAAVSTETVNGTVSPYTAYLMSSSEPFAVDYCVNTNSILSLGWSRDLGRDRFKNELDAIDSSIASQDAQLSVRTQRLQPKPRKWRTESLLQGRAFHHGIPNNFDDSLPDTPSFVRFKVDDSGTFAWIEYSVADPAALIVHLPTMTQVARVAKHAPFALDSDGTLITPKGSVSLQKIRAFGLEAFGNQSEQLITHEELQPLVGANPDKGTLYYLALSGRNFADESFPSLAYCGRDVNELGAAYRRRALTDSMSFRPLILDSNSIRSIAVEERLADLVTCTEPQDTVVIAFATHGVRLRQGLYLATPQTRADSPQGTAVGWPMIADAINKLSASRVIVLLDTCHAESFSESSVELLKEAQVDLQNRPGLTVLASCAADEEALELDEERHGAFTYGLLSMSGQAGMPLDITPQILSKLAKIVASKTDGRQKPIMVIQNRSLKMKDESSVSAP